MGLFKSSPKQPPPPLPALSLRLSHPQDQIFHPNDNLSGTISLTTPLPINPTGLEVTFWGHSSTWIRTSSSDSNNNTSYKHYRDNAPLFTVTYNLLDKPGVQLVPGREYTYAFNFRVPEGTAETRIGVYKDEVDARWTTQSHILPPTFFSGTRDNEEWPDYAKISYGVTAQLICPDLQIPTSKHQDEAPDPLSTTAPILFQPLNPHLHTTSPRSLLRHPKQFTLTSSSLSGTSPATIGFRQKMHDRFSSSTPKLSFELGLEIPELLTLGQEFRFRSTFHVLDKNDRVVHIPAINFKILKLELLSFTFFRAPRDWDAMNTMSGHKSSLDKYHPKADAKRTAWWENDVFREEKTLLNALPAEQIVELEEVMREGEKGRKEMAQAGRCEVQFAARVPGDVPVSFVSWAVGRCYRVKVKLGVEVGEKRFEMGVESEVKYLGGIA